MGNGRVDSTLWSINIELSLTKRVSALCTVYLLLVSLLPNNSVVYSIVLEGPGPCEMQCFAVTAFTSFSFIAILIQIQANQVKVVSSEAEPAMSTEDPEYITLDLSRNDFDIGRTETLPKWTPPSTTTSSKQKRMRKRSDSGRGSMSSENDPLVYRSKSVTGEKETRRSRIFEETGRMDGTKSQIIIEEVEERGFKQG